MDQIAPIEQVRELLGSLQPADTTPSIEELRASYERLCAHAEAPSDLQRQPVDANGVPALLVSAPGCSTDRIVVWLHSGGYLIGSAEGYVPLGYAVSRAADARVLVVDYRLAPEHAYPAAVQDAVAACRWAMDQVGPSATVIAGDSAGGGLTLAGLVALRDGTFGGPEGVLPAAAVSVSGLLDLSSTGESIQRNAAFDPVGSKDTFDMIASAYLQGAFEPTEPLASPLYAELGGLPPLLLMVGTHDVLEDDSRRLAERYRAAGNEVRLEVADGMMHIWPLFHRLLPEGQVGVDTIGAWARTHTS